MIVTATKYSLAPERISAGTRGSYGVEKLEFAFSSDWDGLVISVVFYPSRGKPVKIPYLGGEIDIPPEVMAYDGAAQYVLAGTLIDEEGHVERQIISLRGYIDVENTLPARGGNSGKITPDVYDKFLDEASEKVDRMVEKSLTEAKESGEFKGDKGDPGEMIADITQTPMKDADGNVTHRVTVLTTDGHEESFYISDGKKGESVTVTGVSESSADDGTNIVTFSNGSSLRVKNGKTGTSVSVAEVIESEVSGEENIVRFTDGTEIAIRNGAVGNSVYVNNVIESTEDGGENVVEFTDGKTVRIRNGKTGQNITVAKVSESEEDAGENVVTFSDGATLRIKNGKKGSTGNGIESAVLNDDYTLTLAFTDGTVYTTPSIRGVGGMPATHSWNGTTLTVTSESGTSSADLKGEKGDIGESGVYIGPEETMPAGTKVRIDPNGKRVKIPQIDDTLTKQGYAADAKAVGDALGKLPSNEYIVSVFEELKALIEAGNTDGAIAVLDEAMLDLAVLG